MIDWSNFNLRSWIQRSFTHDHWPPRATQLVRKYWLVALVKWTKIANHRSSATIVLFRDLSWPDKWIDLTRLDLIIKKNQNIICRIIERLFDILLETSALDHCDIDAIAIIVINYAFSKYDQSVYLTLFHCLYHNFTVCPRHKVRKFIATRESLLIVYGRSLKVNGR